MDQFLALIRDFGWPGALFLAICFAGWRSAKFLGARLFDEKTGYVPLAVGAHLQLVGTLEKSLRSQEEVSRRQIELAESHSAELREVRKLIERAKI